MNGAATGSSRSLAGYVAAVINLSIATAISLAVGALGGWIFDAWLAGLPLALVAFGVAWYFLARRTGAQLQAIVARATKELEGGRVEPAKTILREALALGRWQVLVVQQVHAQLGSIEYMQQHWDAARKHLELSWRWNWQPMALLSALDHRQGKHQAAMDRLAGLKWFGGRDAVFWGLWAYIAAESGDGAKALLVIDEGLKNLEGSEALKGMADQLRNKKKLKMKAFAPGWYQFFPDQIPREQLMQMAQTQQQKAHGGYSWPQPRR